MKHLTIFILCCFSSYAFAQVEVSIDSTAITQPLENLIIRPDSTTIKALSTTLLDSLKGVALSEIELPAILEGIDTDIIDSLKNLNAKELLEQNKGELRGLVESEFGPIPLEIDSNFLDKDNLKNMDVDSLVEGLTESKFIEGVASENLNQIKDHISTANSTDLNSSFKGNLPEGVNPDQVRRIRLSPEDMQEAMAASVNHFAQNQEVVQKQMEHLNKKKKAIQNEVNKFSNAADSIKGITKIMARFYFGTNFQVVRSESALDFIPTLGLKLTPSLNLEASAASRIGFSEENKGLSWRNNWRLLMNYQIGSFSVLGGTEIAQTVPNVDTQLEGGSKDTQVMPLAGIGKSFKIWKKLKVEINLMYGISTSQDISIKDFGYGSRFLMTYGIFWNK